jgi:hypothetical protein
MVPRYKIPALTEMHCLVISRLSSAARTLTHCGNARARATSSLPGRWRRRQVIVIELAEQHACLSIESTVPFGEPFPMILDILRRWT